MSQQIAEGGRHVDLSVVIPLYGCADTILPLHQRLTQVVKGLVGSYEIVFVDDRARDAAWAVLERLAASDPCVVAIRMSRNVGQHLAITAGLAECCGDRVVVMDCDLQDPPEIIPVLYARAQEGFDGELGTFSIVSRRVIEAFLQFSERDRHYLMILHAIGFESSAIAYDRDIRRAGKSSYTLRKLIAHALSGMFFSTTRLLHWVIYAGIGLAGSGMLLAITLMLRWFAEGAMPGWTSLIVVQLFVGGVITLCVGVTGLYVGRILEEAQRRPLYFLQDRLDGRTLANARVRPLQRVGQS
jgi:glycosyltransferase involved in cell wall biosynthesis